MRGPFAVRVTSGLDKVEAGVDAVVDHLLAIDAALLLEVGIESGLDILEDGPPAAQLASQNCGRARYLQTHLSSLLTKSPKPGVSTTVRRRRTPFSSISLEMRSRASDCKRADVTAEAGVGKTYRR